MNVARDCDNVATLLSGKLMDHRDELKQLLRRRSLVLGQIKLSSGKMSDYYLDCKLTTMDPRGAVLTGFTILETLDERGIEADAIGGPEIGAIPIVTAVAAVSSIRDEQGIGRPLPAFLVRKTPKEHGRQKGIEGIDLEELKKLRRVVIVDEVCTGGDSIGIALTAVEKIPELKVVAVVSLVDREEGGGEKLRARYKERYIPIFTASELLRNEGQERQTTAGRERVSAGR